VEINCIWAKATVTGGLTEAEFALPAAMEGFVPARLAVEVKGRFDDLIELFKRGTLELLRGGQLNFAHRLDQVPGGGDNWLDLVRPAPMGKDFRARVRFLPAYAGFPVELTLMLRAKQEK
jgi:hypothetical protein